MRSALQTRMLFDWLVTGHIIPVNPAWSVRGPPHVVKRDRALIALMCYSFARVSAVANMNVNDYYQQGKRFWLRLHEKGGKFHEVPAQHNAVEYLDEYLAIAPGEGSKGPLFRSASDKSGGISLGRMSRTDVFRMVKRRGAACGIGIDRICCHTFRATGITAYLENGGTIENAQAIAAHESPRTTKLYDRTDDTLTLDEIERIAI
jgi:integrase